MTTRNLVMWLLAAAMLAWIGAVTWQTKRCRANGGQFVILGWRCVVAPPSVILRRDLQRL